MATSREFTIQAVQAAIFTVDHTAFSSGRAVTVILQEYGERFDGEMQALPLPLETPREIPHVILRSSDGYWRLQMGPARVDAVWTNQSITSSASLDDVVTQAAEMLMHYQHETRATVGRAAMVVRRICSVENPAQILIERFCNAKSRNEPFNRSANFEIHNHKVYFPEREGIDCQINSWVRCKTGTLTEDQQPIILVGQDLNTLASESETRRFTPEQLQSFFQMARLEADEIFAKYFPE